MREIVNSIFYVMRAGCPWRLLPSDLPPWGTIYCWFAAFRDNGRFEKFNHALALTLATDPDLLAGLRARLARNRTTAPLFDSDRFRRHIEDANRTMWAR